MREGPAKVLYDTCGEGNVEPNGSVSRDSRQQSEW